MDVKNKHSKSVFLKMLNFFILPLLKTWVAGESSDNAIAEAIKFQNKSDNLTSIINYLGEHYHSLQPAQNAFNEYIKLIQLIKDHNLRAAISFKPSQLGFNLPENGKQIATDFIRTIVSTADKAGVRCWLEMEDHSYTDFTLELYQDLLKTFDNVAVVIQANLRRSFSDLVRLTTLDRSVYPFPPKFRLCKGIYIEPEEISYRVKSDVNANYKRILEYAFLEAPSDLTLGIATHDEKFIDLALELNIKRPQKYMEFQMLRGIRPELQREVIKKDTLFTLYIPYGEESVPYSYRRAMKANNMRGTIARSVLSAFIRQR